MAGAKQTARPTPAKQEPQSQPAPAPATETPNGAGSYAEESDMNLTDERSLRARLAQKLLILYAEVDYIQKKNRNQQQGYQFVSEADFAEKVSEACRQAKLVIIPDISDVDIKHETVDNGKGGTRLLHLATVKAQYKIVDAETGFTETFRMPGHGQDFSDKAVYKAITGAQKYAYYKLTLCATGTDPETDSPQPQQSRPSTGKQPGASPGAGKPATVTGAPAAQAAGGTTTGTSTAQTAKPAAQSGPQAPPPAKEKAQGKAPDTIPQSSDTPSTPPAQTAPKEQLPLGHPGGTNPSMDGSAEGIITSITPPKGAQKAGQIVFTPEGETEGVIIWFWAERLSDGIALGDLLSFHQNGTPLTMTWAPDVTKRWRTLKTIVRNDIPDMSSPDFTDEAAQQFQQ